MEHIQSKCSKQVTALSTRTQSQSERNATVRWPMTTSEHRANQNAMQQSGDQWQPQWQPANTEPIRTQCNSQVTNDNQRMKRRSFRRQNGLNKRTLWLGKSRPRAWVHLVQLPAQSTATSFRRDGYCSTSHVFYDHHIPGNQRSVVNHYGEVRYTEM